MATIKGKKGNDTLNGTNKADLIYGYDGNDTINAGGGNDTAYGGNGNDIIHGGEGDDRLFGEAGHDRLFGDAGNDLLNGGDGDDYLEDLLGNNQLYGGAGNDRIIGGSGLDEIAGDAGSDTMTGGVGEDHFYWNVQSDAVLGDFITDFESGVDLLWGGQNWDANAALAGAQRWEFVGTTAGPALANGNGQATVTSNGTQTVLQLFNNDGDLNADFTLTVNGNVAPEALQVMLFNDSAGVFNDPAIIFAAAPPA